MQTNLPGENLVTNALPKNVSCLVTIGKIVYMFVLSVVITEISILGVSEGIGLTEIWFCNALTSDGETNNSTGEWTPKSCTLHQYTKRELEFCLTEKKLRGKPFHLATVGDSRIRQFFAQFVNFLDPTLNVSFDGHYSRNRKLIAYDAYVEFNWLPLLSSVEEEFFNRVEREKPSVVIFGHGPHDIAFTDPNMAPYIFNQQMRRLSPYLKRIAEIAPVIWRMPYRSVSPTKYNFSAEAFDRFIRICEKHLPSNVLQWWSSKYDLDRNLNLFKDPIHAGKRLDAVDSQMIYNFICNDVMVDLDAMACFTSSCVFIKRLITILVLLFGIYSIVTYLLPKFGHLRIWSIRKFFLSSGYFVKVHQ